MMKANEHFSRGEWSEAIEYATHADSLDPSFAQALFDGG
jgi:hypothetical protein